MLFYVALTIACFIAATVCLWLFRSMMEVGKSAYRTILPSARGENRRARLANLNTDLATTPSPWGWSGNGAARHASPAAASKTQRPAHEPAAHEPPSREKVPWGWPGSEGLRRSNLDVISDGLESSAAVASVKTMLSRHDAHQLGKGSTAGKDAVGWPYREESFEFAGRNYKVKRQKKSNGGKNAKPWGW